MDDEKTTRDGLRAALEERYDVYVAEDAKSAMELLEREHFAVLLTDFRLPNEDGMKLIARAKSLSKPPICILMTAYGSEELAVDAMKRGADDYIAKGRLQIEELEMRIARALRQQNLESENVTLRQQPREQVRDAKYCRLNPRPRQRSVRRYPAGGRADAHDDFARGRKRHWQGTGLRAPFISSVRATRSRW